MRRFEACFAFPQWNFARKLEQRVDPETLTRLAALLGTAQKLVENVEKGFGIRKLLGPVNNARVINLMIGRRCSPVNRTRALTLQHDGSDEIYARSHHLTPPLALLSKAHTNPPPPNPPVPNVHKLDSPLRGCSMNAVKFKSVQSAQLREIL